MKRFLTVTIAFLSVSSLSVSVAQRRPNEGLPLPEYYGFYLVNNGKLCGIGFKVNGCPFRSETITVGTVSQSGPNEPPFTYRKVFAVDMSKGVRFINYQEIFSSQLGEMKLVPMLYVRNINVDDPQTEIIEKSGTENAWDSGENWIIEGVRNKASEMARPISLLIKPLKNDMVLGVPDSELTPGLYRITRDRRLLDHVYFWVGNPEKARAVKCVDATYTISFGGVLNARFEPCGAKINVKTDPFEEGIDVEVPPAMPRKSSSRLPDPREVLYRKFLDGGYSRAAYQAAKDYLAKYEAKDGQSDQYVAYLKRWVVAHGKRIMGEGNSDSAYANRTFKPSEVDSQARILSRPEPTSPDEDRKNQVSGTVVLRGVFSRGGTVTNLRVISGLTEAINMRCLVAARQIRFTPAMKDGRAVSQYIQIEYNFNLD